MNSLVVCGERGSRRGVGVDGGVGGEDKESSFWDGESESPGVAPDMEMRYCVLDVVDDGLSEVRELSGDEGVDC